MKRHTFRTALVVILALSPTAGAFAAAEKPADHESSMLDTAIDLYRSLSDAQRALAVLPFDSPERTSEVFTPGKRPGIPLRELSDKQRMLAHALLKRFTSEYGAAKCEAITAQDKDGGIDRLYLAFFGEPGAGKTYAWRVAEHHLTLVHVDVEHGVLASVGPILLGANPPTLWDSEEDAMIAVYAAMSSQERASAAAKGKGLSGHPLAQGLGVRVSMLSQPAQDAVRAVYESRLKFFSPDIRDRISAVVDASGGLGAMRIAFFGAADKRCAAGGRWDFKLGGPTFLCDYENSRGHIHMSLKGTVAQKDGK